MRDCLNAAESLRVCVFVCVLLDFLFLLLWGKVHGCVCGISTDVSVVCVLYTYLSYLGQRDVSVKRSLAITDATNQDFELLP